jgi:hypothetical protein
VVSKSNQFLKLINPNTIAMNRFQLFFILVLSFASINTLAQEVVMETKEEMRTKIIKFEFFSPLTGNTTFGYEQYLKDWISLETKLGIIGLGTQPDKNVNDKGFFVSAGPKFKLKPTFAREGTYGTNRLSGGYFRPELTISAFEVGESNFEDDLDLDGRRSGDQIFSIGLMINYGKQWIIGERFSIDWHIGLGYAYVSDGDGGYYYRYFASDSSFPIAINSGFSIGLCTK